ncbi:hypothetical protein [Nostoc sp. UHCC 0870]|nr:hypothetical protein [Nostoc sp. UHCC 0870]UKP00513.1 hypothetical protein L6494_12755 [Nostoc sp. UHCC 0870]
MKKSPTPFPQTGLLTQGLDWLLFLPPTPLHPYTPTPLHPPQRGLAW